MSKKKKTILQNYSCDAFFDGFSCVRLNFIICVIFNYFITFSAILEQYLYLRCIFIDPHILFLKTNVDYFNIIVYN